MKGIFTIPILCFLPLWTAVNFVPYFDKSWSTYAIPIDFFKDGLKLPLDVYPTCLSFESNI